MKIIKEPCSAYTEKPVTITCLNKMCNAGLEVHPSDIECRYQHPNKGHRSVDGQWQPYVGYMTTCIACGYYLDIPADQCPWKPSQFKYQGSK